MMRTLLAATACLLACSVASQSQPHPSDILELPKGGVVVHPAEVVASGEVTDFLWDAQGRFLFFRSVLPGWGSETFTGSRKPPEPQTTFGIYSLASRRVVATWSVGSDESRFLGGGFLNAAGAFLGFFTGVDRGQTRILLLRVQATGAVQILDEFPADQNVGLIQAPGSDDLIGWVTGEEAGELFRISARGSLLRRKTDARITSLFAVEGGRMGFLQTGDGPAALQLIDPRTLRMAQRISPWPAEGYQVVGEDEPAANVAYQTMAVPAGASSFGKPKADLLLMGRVGSGPTLESLTLASGADSGSLDGRLSRPGNAVAFVVSGALLVRRIDPIDTAVMLEILAEAERLRIRATISQADSALRQFAEENGGVLPGTAGNWLESLSPYIKNAPVALQGLILSTPGRRLAEITNPAATEFISLSGRFGRGVVMADGTFRWIPHTPTGPR